MLICGDFNFPKIHWESPDKTKGADEIAFVEQLGDYYLTQLNTIPTRGKHILDLVIISKYIFHFRISILHFSIKITNLD